MTHPTEDELIQHLCGEDGPRDRERLQDHLAAVRGVPAGLRRDHGRADARQRIRARAADWVSSASCGRACSSDRRRCRCRRGGRGGASVPAGAVAAMAVAGIAIASQPALTPNADVTVAQSSASSAPAALRGQASTRDLVLYTALDNHFRQTEMLLVEVRNASERDSLDYERMSAQELITAGRLYRMTAEDGGHPRLVADARRTRTGARRSRPAPGTSKQERSCLVQGTD